MLFVLFRLVALPDRALPQALRGFASPLRMLSPPGRRHPLEDVGDSVFGGRDRTGQGGQLPARFHLPASPPGDADCDHRYLIILSAPRFGLARRAAKRVGGCRRPAPGVLRQTRPFLPPGEGFPPAG